MKYLAMSLFFAIFFSLSAVPSQAHENYILNFDRNFDAETANALWPLIANSGDPLLFTHYLEYFPDSEHSEDARRKLDDFEGTDAGFWRSIGEDTSLASERYISYLKRYPDGEYAEIAREKSQEFDTSINKAHFHLFLIVLGIGCPALLCLYFSVYYKARYARCDDNSNENKDCMS